MGSIYVKGRRLYLSIKNADGQWRQLASGLSVGDEARARKMLADLEKGAERERRVGKAPDGPLTVAKWSAKWLEAREKVGVRDVGNERNRLKNHVLPALGGFRVDAVKVRHVKDLVAGLRTTGKLAPRTIHTVYGLVHKMFQDAVMEELIEANPCQLDKSYLGKKRDKDPAWRAGAIFTRAELEALISDSRIPVDRRLVYALEGLAGLRHGEAAGLRWEHYDADAKPLGQLLVAFSYDKATKTERPRRVPVHPVLAAMIAEWKLAGWDWLIGRRPESGDLIVPSRRNTFRTKGQACRTRHLDLDALGWRRRRGHDLRRTFISLARADGARPDLLKLITHGPGADMISIYTEMPWETLCEQVAGLRIERRAESVPVRLALSTGVSTGDENASDTATMAASATGMQTRRGDFRVAPFGVVSGGGQTAWMTSRSGVAAVRNRLPASIGRTVESSVDRALRAIDAKDTDGARRILVGLLLKLRPGARR
jgi:integrase